MRESTGLSQAAFADRIKTPRRTYQSLEDGDTTRLTAEALAALVKMGVDLAALVSRETKQYLLQNNRVAEPRPSAPDPGADPTLNHRLRQVALEAGHDPTTIPAYYDDYEAARQILEAVCSKWLEEGKRDPELLEELVRDAFSWHQTMLEKLKQRRAKPRAPDEEPSAPKASREGGSGG